MAVEWSDTELVRGMLAGSKPAWHVFSQRYDGIIYAAIDRVLRSFSGVEARVVEREEIRAVLLCSLLSREMHKLRVFEFERGVRLSSWIHLLATNAARDHLRVVMRHRRRLSLNDTLVDVPDDWGTGPLGRLLANELLERVESTLECMSDKDRQLMDLLVVRGEDPSRVAQTMNISVKTVYTEKHKLMRRLREAL
ncbi:MAG: sigma-70 family RNA polymerase sigma factor [Polyangiales bacterium]